MTKTTQLYVCKCLAFSTHVWEKPPTCLFPPELSVGHYCGHEGLVKMIDLVVMVDMVDMVVRVDLGPWGT